jgi:chromate transporter
MDDPASPPPDRRSLGEIGWLFLKLGTIAFGGPAAHIAMMRQEVVQRRRWLDDQRFLDLIAACNLIPGPNSTELAIHIGYLRGGWPGLLVAGSLFIIPAMLSVLALAWAYVTYGSLPELGWLLYGIKPVIIAIVVQALWGLGRSALKGPLLLEVALVVFVLYRLEFNEIALLFGGGVLVLLARRLRGSSPPGAPTAFIVVPWWAMPKVLTQVGVAVAAYSPGLLFWSFLKIGSVLYGSGYVLLAFLRPEFVERLGWLSDQQLLDAVAIGQFTPGPVFTTATFIGYVIGAAHGGVPDGIIGALAATMGIFLPAFVFVALSVPLVPRLRSDPRVASLLDGINAASLGLMAGVTFDLGRASLIDPITVILAVIALVLLLRTTLNSAWLVIGGGLIGIVTKLLLP